jgi:nucleoside-diphosphate-sugar epimerase
MMTDRTNKVISIEGDPPVMATDVGDLAVDRSTPLERAMEVIDRNGFGIVLVTDELGELVGTATDGDIRRGILDGVGLDEPITEVFTEDPLVAHDNWDVSEIEERLNSEELRNKISEHDSLAVPVVDDDGVPVNVTHVDRSGEVTATESTVSSPVDTVLVIGGAGHIGSVLCEELIADGYSVRVLDTLIYGDEGISSLLDHDNFELIEGDMRSIETVVDAIKGVDAVVHLAALVGDPASAIDAQKTLELNYHAVKLVAEICKYHQVNRFLFASTCSVYGRSHSPEKLLTETDRLNPVSLYAKTKIESERALREMADSNFSPTILRMGTIYGLSPRMRFDLVVNILSAKAYEEGIIPIFGGDQYRPNVHVRDAARAYVNCLEAPIEDVSNEIFNVGSNDQNYQIKDMGERIAEVFPDAEIDWQREKEDERSYQVDFTKVRETLGFEARHTIKDGAREIREAFEDGQFDDYTRDRYSNYRTLESNLDQAVSN